MKAWILTVEYNNNKGIKESFTCQACEETFEKALYELCCFAESVGVLIGEYYIDAYSSEINSVKGIKIFKDSNPFHAPFKIDTLSMTQEEVEELNRKKLDEFN